MRPSFVFQTERVVNAATEAYSGRISIDEAVRIVGAPAALRQALQNRDLDAFLALYGQTAKRDQTGKLEFPAARLLNAVYMANTVGARKLLGPAMVVSFVIEKRGLAYLFEERGNDVFQT